MEIEFHDEREFEKWLRAIGGIDGGRVAGKLSLGANLGGSVIGMPLVRALGGGLSEIRVTKYRIYFSERAQTMLVLTAGEKDTQQRDIMRARRRMQ